MTRAKIDADYSAELIEVDREVPVFRLLEQLPSPSRPPMRTLANLVLAPTSHGGYDWR
jgi:hypothetical protein